MADIWDKLEQDAFSSKKDASNKDIWDRLENSAFGIEEKPATRNPAAFLNDTVITGANAALGGVQAVSDFISPGNRLSQGIESLVREGEESQSNAVKQGRAKLGKAMESEDVGTQLKGVKDYVLQNPVQAAAMAAGSFALPFGAIKGAKLASGALGLGEKAAGRLATGTGMATSGVMAGGDAAGDAYQQVMDSPDLAFLPINERESLATSAARKASVVPFVIGGISGAFGADKALATGTRSLLKTGASEFVSEAFEEGSTKLSANIAAENAGVNVGIWKGVAGSAALGGLLGGATGLTVGAMTKQPDSLLPGSTNISTGQQAPDNNAINKAIDANSTEINTNSGQQVIEIQQKQAELQQAQADAKAQADQAAAQQAQQKAQEQQQAFIEVASTYGFTPNATGTLSLGKILIRTPEIAQQYITQFEIANKDKSPTQKALFGAALSSGAVPVKPGATPKAIATSVNTFLNNWQLAGIEDKVEAADWINTVIPTIEGASALKEAAPLNEFYKSLTGQDAPAFASLLEQATEKPTKTKGVKDEQLQQLQTDAGLRAVPVQGGATQISGNQPGDVRPVGVQPIQPGSLGEGSLSLQTGAVPSGGVSTSTSAGGSGVNIPNAGIQAQGQVNANQPKVTTKKRRGGVPEQVAEGSANVEQTVEEKATGIVETVVRNVIDAVVKRKGRMSNVNLQKLKDFIYYDFSQIENKAAKTGELTKKELADMFDVSTDTIDGWQDIANNFFEENRGVIQAQLYQTLDASGMSLLELKDQIQASRDFAVGEAVSLEEEERRSEQVTEVNREDEEDFEQNAVENAEAADLGLTQVEDESQLDQRDLQGEKTGMGVYTGRTGVSVQEENKPEETINARYIRKAKELEEAENSGDEELSAKLSKELDALVDEAAGVAKKQVAKSEAIAGEKKKETKNAVQKRSTKGVSVRKQAEVSEGVPSKDTEERPAATKSKTNEKSRSLTVVESKQAEEDFNTQKKLLAKIDAARKTLRRAEDFSSTGKAKLAVQKAEAEYDAFEVEARPRAEERIAALTGTTIAAASKKDALAWNLLPVPVKYEQLSPQAKADWAISVRNGKMNLADASRVYDENEDNIIDGTDLITEVGEQKQFLMLTNQVNKLNEAQINRLEKHYGEKRNTPDFLQSLKEDVIRYIDISADAVSAAIRDIIKSISNGVMAMAVVFNPTMVSQPFQFAVPTYETKTVEVVAQVPAEAAQAMSPAAKRAYEVIYPTIKDQLVKNDKLFVVTDKPTATNFIFSPDGTLLFQSKVLIGKTEGNYYKGDNNIVANRVTAAGLYNMGLRTGGKTAADYDFNKVFGIEQIENGKKYFVTMMHSVYTKESDAAQRVAALKEAGPQNSRYSFGCINVDKETFGKILAGHEKQMDGAKLFIVPDGTENVMEFINGKAVYSSDMVREKAEPILKTEKVPKQGTGTTEQTIAAKEEKATEETTRLSSKSKQFFFDEIEDTERGFDSIRGNLVKLGIENSLDFVSNWSFVDVKGGEPGAIESIGGRYVVTVNNNAELTNAFIAETARHELGHAVDMAPHGGIYSAQKEMGVVLKDGVITPVGAVSREMQNLYKTDPVWNEFLAYPFDAKTFTDLNTHVKIEAELFAQLFAVYTDPRGRAKLEAEAPITAAYMKEVVNDIKSSKALQIQTPRTAAERVVRFQNRNATQRPQAPSGSVPERQKETGVVLRSRSVKEARIFAEKQINKLPEPVRTPLQSMMANIYDFAKKGLLAFSFTEDMADMAAKYMPSVKKYIALSNERKAIRIKFELNVDQILQKYDALPSEVKGTGENSVNRFLKDTTMSGKWAYNPGWIKKFDETKDIDADAKARFNAMPAEAQSLIKEVFSHGQNMLLAMQKAVNENINTEYDALISAANAVNDTKEAAKLTKDKASTLTEYNTLMRTNSTKPYAPLKRFGNYVVVGKSQLYIENETIANSKTAAPDKIAEARKKMRELEKLEEHYFVRFAETAGEANAIVQDESKNHDYLEYFEKDTSQGYGVRDLNDVFNRLRNMVEEDTDSTLSEASQKAMNRLMADLKLTLLSETSARQSERQRKNIAGAEDDMMRSFATQGRATANFIASLTNSGDIYDALRDMKNEADSYDGEGKRLDRRRYYNEFMKRHFMGMDYQPSPFIDKALSTTSMWMLLTNPAYYLQNSTQAFMMSLPSMAGKHGYTRSWKEMQRAYTDVFNVIREHGLNEKSYAKLPADVRQVVEELVKRGRIDISLEQDLGRWRSTEDSKLAKFGNAMDKLRGIAQDIETVNRVATAVAAYRLEVKRSNPTNATNYADKIIYTTHGDYSVTNAPRITRSGLGRLATQFRKFQLIQISLIARLSNDAFAGQDAETRMIGKKALAFTIGHTAVMGGIMGLPGFSAIAFLYGLLFGDDDEPDNPELALRRAIGDDTIADLLVKGVPAALGVDLSGKLGMGNMLSILPYTDVSFTRKDLPAAGYALLTGPFGGLTLKAADAVDYMGRGDYYKGIEQLVPTGLSNTMKGYRYGTEGITSKTGDVTMSADDISAVDGFMVALGLPTKTITDRQFLQNAKFKYDEFYNDKTSELKREYVRAYDDGDVEARRDVIEEWKKLQQSRAENGYTRQPLSTLLKAPQEKRKRERNTVGGVAVNKANRGFVRQTSEL
ncbi:hypothetical protein UFOVP285_33 [uncultured Caudovirales phage]|uniref:Uncharacterized protein n=1 Tax=uncultured Caudovirales phage TaxID=2100421 RepID=A0A6J5LM92_9CAUD|nr:hypothetical protein UFOVP285_33 [uncultured Caudovirales phage]